MTNPADWETTLTGFTRSLRRLEQQPVYTCDTQSGALDSWLAGGPAVHPDDLADTWCQLIKQRTSSGATVERIRVHDTTLTLYQLWLREASAPNIEAGEQIRLLSRHLADTNGITEHAGDWWLVDGHTLIQFTFDARFNRTVHVTTEPDAIETASHWWDIAYKHSESGCAVQP